MTHALPVRSSKFNDRGVLALIGTGVIYLLIYTHLASFLTSKAGVPSTPVFALIFALGLTLASGFITQRPSPRSTKFIIISIVIYVLLLIFNMLFSDVTIFELIKNRLSWAAATVGAIIVLSNIRDPKSFLWIVRISVGISAAIVLLEFFSHFDLPIEMTTVKGRAAGLFENPNTAALFLSAAIPIVTMGLQQTSRFIWYAVITTCVFLTFSRGGLAVCGLAILMVEAFPAGRGAPTLKRLLLIALSVIVVLAFYNLFANFIVTNFGSSLDANTVVRARLEGDASSRMRLYVLQLAWEGFSSSPFWGHGVGAADRWQSAVSTHNMFALVILEQGIVGLAWMVAFVLALFSIRSPYGLWAAGVFTAGGMFSHNLFDAPTHGIIIATYAALPMIFADPSSRASRTNVRLHPNASRFSRAESILAPK